MNKEYLEGAGMTKSLFRLTDMLELSIAYIFCFFLDLLFDYVKTVELDSYILKVFVKNFIDYQTFMVLLFTSIVIVFHYQMLHRKKAEIFCKILVGDTVFNITVRYVRDCLIILVFVYLNFSLTDNLYLVLIFIIYILISARQVQKLGSSFQITD